MQEINRKRLEWMAQANPGDLFPDDIFPSQSWGPPMTEMAKEALAALGQTSPDIQFDPARDVVTLAGVPYSMSLFRALPLGTRDGEAWRVRREGDGVIVHSVVPYGDWQPIDTAPVKPWTPELPSYYNFNCLLQLEPRGGNPPTVIEGQGYWVPPSRQQRKDKGPLLRWRAQYLGVIQPKYWMPMPAPKED